MVNNHFTAIVIGNNPEEIIAKYDSNKKIDQYLVYSFSKRNEYKQKYIDIQEGLLKQTKEENRKQLLSCEIERLKNEDDVDFYLELTEGLIFNEETGDAYSDRNKDGKYTSAKVGGKWALPLITKDGKETYSARKSDIDFNKIHRSEDSILPYKVAWETVMEKVEPKNEEERKIYENMKERVAYFDQFKTKENYIIWSTSFWAYAIIDQNGWKEFNGGFDDQIKWVDTFFDKYIKDLPDDTLVTIYECTRD